MWFADSTSPPPQNISTKSSFIDKDTTWKRVNNYTRLLFFLSIQTRTTPPQQLNWHNSTILPQINVIFLSTASPPHLPLVDTSRKYYCKIICKYESLFDYGKSKSNEKVINKSRELLPHTFPPIFLWANVAIPECVGVLYDHLPFEFAS